MIIKFFLKFYYLYNLFYRYIITRWNSFKFGLLYWFYILTFVMQINFHKEEKFIKLKNLYQKIIKMHSLDKKWKNQKNRF